ncbi:MAG: alpha-1,2-fucosyltransferase [Cyanobacteriota bacterium]
MLRSDPLRLLLQGGLGNQLFQAVLASTLAARWGRPLVVDPVLLGSRLRRLRGLTPRSLSPLVAQLLPDAVQATPWHHWVGARLAARGPGTAPPWLLTDAALAQAAAEGSLLEGLEAIRLLRTHATHPALYTPPFEAAWRAVAAALKPMGGSAEPPAFALHARRGDYLHPRSGFFPLQATYYRRALATLQGHPAIAARGSLTDGGRPPVLHVFSDDPAWCRAQLGGAGWELRLEEGSPETDLARLASAHTLVLSNSSFSAVAGHLARLRDPTSLVLCPDRWLLKEDGRLGDLRSPDWQTVEV